jgi:proteasome assembly chaperone 2
MFDEYSTPSYYYIPCSSASPPQALTAALEAVQLQQFTSPPVPSYLQSDDVSSYANTKDSTSDVPFMPGGGLTRRVLNSLGENWKVPFVVLLQFVFEGDNRGDAGMMVALVNRLLDLKLERE